MVTPPTVSESRLRAPLGFHLCKIDGAGRLKLPARHQEYLRGLADGNLFATVHEGKARIFTNGSWERTLGRITDKAVRDRFAFRAERDGGDVDLDPQGRVTLPQGLRKKLSLEDKSVQIRFKDDVITFFSQEEYDARSADVDSYEASDAARLAFLELDS
jgi:DNA-binding transcriptional regulator/RsmH inhibitor MraZ